MNAPHSYRKITILEHTFPNLCYSTILKVPTEICKLGANVWQFNQKFPI
ncbi:MAG: hypothetical protein GFH27_549357n53 [Chloroflexi bacterium AL-W]|nr:hypothetical protein [Chloroflexi bacterium AL-N1]NOK70690.1 hypothetical protein [Chloroflexi bacterium AL-N10]NOK78509.1 hypothetical protein [Chloroflexi bacterium AL-N5]NOK85593.1 hypothetical protein [Chloroflexi bacterium AL-W]NOK92507.1 hypothetical protein [Chloroflexi bacterium AL-N15]